MSSRVFMSKYRAKTKGANPSLIDGPNLDLLIDHWIETKGPLPSNRKGPNKQFTRGPNTLLYNGPNRSFYRGPGQTTSSSVSTRQLLKQGSCQTVNLVPERSSIPAGPPSPFQIQGTFTLQDTNISVSSSSDYQANFNQTDPFYQISSLFPSPNPSKDTKSVIPKDNFENQKSKQKPIAVQQEPEFSHRDLLSTSAAIKETLKKYNERLQGTGGTASGVSTSTAPHYIQKNTKGSPHTYHDDPATPSDIMLTHMESHIFTNNQKQLIEETMF